MRLYRYVAARRLTLVAGLVSQILPACSGHSAASEDSQDAGGDAEAGADYESDAAPVVAACTPKTCDDLQVDCGSLPDDCGVTYILHS